MKVLSNNYRQEPPFAIQVEFTEGCNFSCTFCGLQGIRSKPGNYKFLTLAIAERIASEIARVEWNARIEFAMHGEPSFNPNRDELVSIFRKHLPKNQLMMTSNGSGFVKEPAQQVKSIFDAGLNILALDDYEGATMVPRIRKAFENEEYIPLFWYDYPKNGLDFSPHRRWPIGTRIVIFIEDLIKANKGSHARITNHCGAGAPPNDSSMGKRCAKPFRELSIRWDGTIAGCCNDWRGVYKIGDLTKKPIDELWNNAAFTAMRRKLYHGLRDFGACKGCDYVSYRNGLLPDHRGYVKLPLPNEEDWAAIRKATRGDTLTQIVLRPWEEDNAK